LDQNSQNSNKPPSTDTFVRKKTQSDEKKSDRLPGGQKGHPGSTLKTFDSPHESLIIASVTVKIVVTAYCRLRQTITRNERKLKH
jgi:hypothetical protein